MRTGLTPSAPTRRSVQVGDSGRDGRAGKSRTIQSPSFVAVRSPLCVWKRATLSRARIPSSHRTWAAASVACPQSLTSTAGVNQRRPKPSDTGTGKAVSARFISRATACIQAGSAAARSRHTPAGFPLKGSAVKASTWKIGVFMSGLRSSIMKGARATSQGRGGKLHPENESKLMTLDTTRKAVTQ
jgi:hypothetical protein